MATNRQRTQTKGLPIPSPRTRAKSHGSPVTQNEKKTPATPSPATPSGKHTRPLPGFSPNRSVSNKPPKIETLKQIKVQNYPSPNLRSLIDEHKRSRARGDRSITKYKHKRLPSSPHLTRSASFEPSRIKGRNRNHTYTPIDHSPSLKPSIHRKISTSRSNRASPRKNITFNNPLPRIHTNDNDNQHSNMKNFANLLNEPGIATFSPEKIITDCTDQEYKFDLNSHFSPNVSQRKPNQINKPQGTDYSIIKSLPSPYRADSPLFHTFKIQFGQDMSKKNIFAEKEDDRECVIRSSCQCKGVEFELLSVPEEMQHCYCSMCRKMHGSSVATWTPIALTDIRITKKGNQTEYKSSEHVTRSFCSVCGSNISLQYSFQSDTIWITPSLFDEVTVEKHKNWWQNVRILHIFCSSKNEWFTIPNDGNPQLSQNDIQNSEVNGIPKFSFGKKKIPRKLPRKPRKNNEKRRANVE